MGELQTTAMSLRIIGDDVIPNEISALLGCEPHFHTTKGQLYSPTKKGKLRVANFSSWRFKAEDRCPGDFDSQIEEILSQMTDDAEKWTRIPKSSRVEMFCGLFMETPMEGIGLSADSIAALATRGISMDFDMYCSLSDYD